MSFSVKVGRSALWAITGQGITALLAIVNFSVIGRYIEPSEYGSFLIALMALTATQWLASNAYKEPLVQSQELTDNEINSVFSFTILVGFSLFLIMVLVGGWYGYFKSAPVIATSIVILAIKLLLDTVSSVPSALRVRNLDFKFFARLLIFANLTATVTNIGMLYSGFGVISLVWSQLIASLISFLVILYFDNRRYSIRIRSRDLKILRNYSPHVIMWQGMDAVGQTLDRYFIASRLTLIDLGFYGFGKRLNDVVIDILVGATSSVSLPAFSQLQNDKARLQVAFLKAVRIVFLMVLPTIAILYATADDFIPLFLGPKWIKSIPVYRWFLLLGVIQAIGILQGSLLRSLGHQGVWTRYVFSQCVSNILLLSLVSGYGIEVIAASIVIRAYIFWGWVVIKVCKILELRVSQYIFVLIKPMCIAAISSGVGLALRSTMMESSYFLRFFVDGTVVGIVFIILAIVFLRDSVLEAVGLLQNLISKR